MIMGYDPEAPAGYQDADIEMLELAEAPASEHPQCSYCYGDGVNDLHAYGSRRTVWIPHCSSKRCKAAAVEEKQWVEQYD